MRSKIYLFDVSALVYAGNAVPNDDCKIIEESVKFPVAGIRYAIRRILGHSVNGDVIAVFDSRTDKNTLFPEYKAQRNKDNDVFFQKEVLKYVLPKLGVRIACKDNYEADDLIYSLVYSLVNQSEYSQINIIADDADIAGAMISPRVVRLGATSKTHTLTTENYPFVIKSNAVIEYNSILAYFMFHGKQSNNVPALPNSKGNYESFINYVRNNNIPQHKWSEKAVMAMYLKNLLASDNSKCDFVKSVIDRFPVIYPKLDGMGYRDVPSAKLDKQFASEFLALMHETTATTYLGVARLDPHSVELGKFDKFVRLYRSGTILVDNNLTSDPSFGYTNSFGDDNLNIRSF